MKNIDLFHAIEANLIGICQYINYINSNNKKTLNIKKYDISNIRVMLAFSGGKDSVGLLSVCSNLKKKYSNLYLNACYVNHCMQSFEEQEKEQKTVRQTCKLLDVELLEKSLCVIEQKENKFSEAEARKYRYNILMESALTNNIDYIITAHHKQDQFETILMRILKSKSIFGLKGIPNVRLLSDNPRLYLVRPALSITQILLQKNVNVSDVMPYLENGRDVNSDEFDIEVKDNNLPYHTDLSNADNKYLRNKIRHNLSRIMQQEFPQSVNSILTISQNIYSQNVDNMFINKNSSNLGILELYMLRSDFETKMISERKNILYRELNKLGLNSISSVALSPLLKHILPSHIKLTIGNILIKLNTYTLTLSKLEKNNTSFLESIICVNNQIPLVQQTMLPVIRNNFKLQVIESKNNNLNTKCITFDLSYSNNLKLNFFNKHDVLLKNNHKINIQSYYHKINYYSSDNKIPILIDDIGIICVIGSVYNMPDMFRDGVLINNESENISNITHKKIPFTLKITFQSIEIIV